MENTKYNLCSYSKQSRNEYLKEYKVVDKRLSKCSDSEVKWHQGYIFSICSFILYEEMGSSITAPKNLEIINIRHLE